MWLLVFFLTPIAEMYLLIEVAGYIDTLPTVALVMLTAVIGVFLLKRQGVATLTRGMRRLDEGQLPATEMVEGLLLAVAGALLVTPGFITDTVGFLLLFPPTRLVIAGVVLKRVQIHQAYSVHSAGSTAGPDSHSDPFRRPGSPADDAIEGEFKRRD